jgi:hypothetical protein
MGDEAMNDSRRSLLSILVHLANHRSDHRTHLVETTRDGEIVELGGRRWKVRTAGTDRDGEPAREISPLDL